jgi:hypothetical protein
MILGLPWKLKTRFLKNAVNPSADLASLRNLTRIGSVGKSAVRIGNFAVIFIVLSRGDPSFRKSNTDAGYHSE